MPHDLETENGLDLESRLAESRDVGGDLRQATDLLYFGLLLTVGAMIIATAVVDAYVIVHTKSPVLVLVVGVAAAFPIMAGYLLAQFVKSLTRAQEDTAQFA